MDDLVQFAEDLRRIEKERKGEARLVSKAEDSEFVLKMKRPGGDLVFIGKHSLGFFDDDLHFEKKVSYVGRIDSEKVGSFLTDLIRDIENSCGASV